MNDDREVIAADILIQDNKILQVEKNIPVKSDYQVIDASNQFVLPGLIQTHIHLCQTLFRGYADDLELMDWLKNKIWPMEFHHTPNSLKASSDLALAELISLGTTSILDMATTKHTEAVFSSVESSQLRYWGGKCLMDYDGFCGPLLETTQQALIENEQLFKQWHQKNELINYALCPRFVVSCTEELLLECKKLQQEHGLIIHTHASENKDEIAIVEKRTGLRNIEYLDRIGLLNQRSAIAHCIHINDDEKGLMQQSGAHVLHCPSSNLKLASGIAHIHEYIEKNISVSLGADGAPCNNTLDPFMEMRLCALLQKPIFGSTALPAMQALELATLGGAKTLGMQGQLGSLQEGYLADIITVDRTHPSVCTIENPYSAIVYSCSGRDVKNSIINGVPVYKNKQHQTLDIEQVTINARKELNGLLTKTSPS